MTEAFCAKKSKIGVPRIVYPIYVCLPFIICMFGKIFHLSGGLDFRISVSLFLLFNISRWNTSGLGHFTNWRQYSLIQASLQMNFNYMFSN